MSIGPWQVLLVLGIVLIIFGPSKIPGLGKSLGQAIRGFKKGLNEDEIDVTDKTKIEKDEKDKES
jgi:sec-independent protein translocase protein TatA